MEGHAAKSNQVISNPDGDDLTMHGLISNCLFGDRLPPGVLSIPGVGAPLLLFLGIIGAFFHLRETNIHLLTIVKGVSTSKIFSVLRTVTSVEVKELIADLFKRLKGHPRERRSYSC